MRVARVFPTKTSMTPTDQDAYYTPPKLNTPVYDEVHVSCQFTWDKEKASDLATQWRKHGTVKIGGVAIDGESDLPFKAGMYLRKGIVICHRGCGNGCPWCIVKGKKLIEFDAFDEGNIIQGNNVLKCSKRHWRLLLSMLRKQRAIEFKGGLEASRITPEIADDLRSLRIKTLWLACDAPDKIEVLRKAVNTLLKAGFTRNHLYCYALIGDNARENIHRLREIWKIGCMPFAQLYKPREYSKSWHRFQRRWDIPIIVRRRMKSIPIT